MVLCFGELLLRLSAAPDGKWLEKNSFGVYVGGAEMNVAHALAHWRVPVCYCTAMPKNFLTKHLVNDIKEKHVDTSTILYKGDKLGFYYLEDGLSVQHAEVIYDRKHSSFAELKKGMFDWDRVLDGIRWFHFSAITPALNKNLVDVCEEALQACERKSIFVSVDLNYRPKLWQYGRKPNEVMPKLMQYCDAAMGNVWSAETMLGVPLRPDLAHVNRKDAYLQQARETSERIAEMFPKCKIVANTFRFGEDEIHYYGTLFSNRTFYVSAEYKGHPVVDKVGSGDCFMAGLIYGMFNRLPFQQTINFSTAAAFTKLFIKGDCTNKTADEIRSFMMHYE